MTLRRVIIGDTLVQQISADGDVSFKRCDEGRRPDSYPNAHSYSKLGELISSPDIGALMSKRNIDPAKTHLDVYGRYVLIRGLGKAKVVNNAEDNSWIQVRHPLTGQKLTVYDMYAWDLIQHKEPNELNDAYL